jgi:hypothetical protein
MRVAPEVIKILLLQRNKRLPDAPPEHVNAIELFVGSKFPLSILSSSEHVINRMQSVGGKFLFPLRSAAKQLDKKVT